MIRICMLMIWMQKTNQHFPKCILGTYLQTWIVGPKKFFKALFSAQQSTALAVPGLFRIRLAEIFADVGQVSW